MATADDGRAPHESRGDGDQKSRKRHCRPEIKEEPQNVAQEAWRINLTGVPNQLVNSASISVTVGVPELEQMSKQMTFTRSEIQCSTVLLQLRVCDNVAVERNATDLPIIPMASPQHPTTIENLPGDILFKIFNHLLAKQLARMRCVSKYWNALLSGSSFIKSHLHHSIHNNDQILLVFYNNAIRNDDKVFSAYPSRSPHHELTNFIKLPHVTNFIKVIGSVHGLICSCYGDSDIHIWNPSLSRVLTLPPCFFPYCGYYKNLLRFGYDPKTEDYKVVKITGLIGSLSEEQILSSSEDATSLIYVIKKWLQVEIYSMRNGSWKLISHRVPSHITRIFNKDEVCVDGHDGRLHWVGHTAEKRDSEMILAFDLGSETFLEMNLPHSILDHYRSNTLGVLGGKLCVMSRDGNGGIDVWVMDEYGVAESWVKRHVFRILHYLGDILTGFTSHNEFLIEDHEECLVLYDPIADKAKILEKDCRGLFGGGRIVEYIDSLVWVAPSVRAAFLNFNFEGMIHSNFDFISIIFVANNSRVTDSVHMQFIFWVLFSAMRIILSPSTSHFTHLVGKSRRKGSAIGLKIVFFAGKCS